MNPIESLPNLPRIGVRHPLVRGGILRFGWRAGADEGVPDTSDLGLALPKVSGTALDRAMRPVESGTAIREPRRCLTPFSLRFA